MGLHLSEIVAALTHALDMTEGQPVGHARRTCLIGMELAERAGVSEDERSSLFYALLLKDAGCSTNAAQVAALYGTDDPSVKRDRKTTNHLRPAESVAHLWRQTAPGAGPVAKARHLRALVAHGSDGSRALTQMRCERGAEIARMVGLDERSARAIRDLDEHWDGRGYPSGLRGDAISPLGRILCLAQTMEVFWQDGGAPAACAVARERSGTWFDPELVHAATSLEHDRDFWSALERADVAAVEPMGHVVTIGESGLDRLCEAFARIIDAKSPYTALHSEGVAWIAAALGRSLGLDDPDCATLRRAGLLHDIGKLAVSNRILDKPGKLDPDEWKAMRDHPALTFEILDRVAPFRRFAFMAAAHHERLDGTGYHLGIGGSQLDLPSRILAVADVAEALSATRPYREALSADDVLQLVARDAGSRLDASAVDALAHVLPAWLARTGTPAALAA
jgi:putative nucleotidyltransferase with HDIG domain